ncbi:MAG: hypothetical protein AB7F32_08390 [Victivallaceae bacterium]
MNRFTTPLVAVGLAMLCGCSIFNKGRQIITVTTDPPDSRLIINGVEYPASSPQFVEVIPSREVLITAYKPYYRTRLYVVDYHLNDTGKVDAWGGMLLFPLIGLMTNGAWELEENNIYLKLEPMTQSEVDVLNRTTKPLASTQQKIEGGNAVEKSDKDADKAPVAKPADDAKSVKPADAAVKPAADAAKAPEQKPEKPLDKLPLLKPVDNPKEAIPPVQKIEKAIEKLSPPKIEKPAETK